MQPSEWSVVQTATAAEVCRSFELSNSGRALLDGKLTPPQFLALLLSADERQDAICFLAQALPKREAVWWGCLCLWDIHRPEPEDVRIAAILEAAVRWVLDPSDENRLAAWAPALAVPIQTAAGCLGRAVIWSGGSMHPPHLPAVPPPAHLTGRTVSGAVQLAAVPGNAEQIARKHRRFLALGVEVAAGVNRWETPASVKPILEGKSPEAVVPALV